MKRINKLKLKVIDTLSGMSVNETLEMLKVHQYLPEEELNAWRMQQLKKLFDIAHTSAPFYKNIASYEDAPVITKNTMKQHPKGFLSATYEGKPFRKFTGGTTGTPFPYYTSELSQSYLWAGLILSWESSGYRFGDRVAFIAGSALLKTDSKHKLFYSLLNVDKYPVASLDDTVIEQHLTLLRKRNTQLIYGYAMAINLIADYIRRNNLPPLEYLKGVVCTSEVLTDNMRANIEDAFGVKVYNQYGCNEAGLSAFECEHGNMHLISSRCIYETNSKGELISTDLANDAWIFMKYNTGDIVEFSNKKCSCGRTYPVIANIGGRTTEYLVDQREKMFLSSYFNFLFKNEKSIKQFQVIFDEQKISVNLGVDDQFCESKRLHFLEALKEQMLFDEYEIILNGKFQTGKNLKHTFIVDKRNQSVPVSA